MYPETKIPDGPPDPAAELRARLSGQLSRCPITGSPATMRARFAQLLGPGPAGVACTLGGVPCTRFGPEQPAPAAAPATAPIILWLHGGGYVFGSAATHARAAASLAQRAGATVFVPDYRLAPEHPWPAPLHDAAAVLKAFEAPVGVVGDSAGGHLALALARRHPDRINALALLSPNTDRTQQSRTRGPNSSSDLTNSDEDDAALARIAMPDLPAAHPNASPILADLSLLPPCFVTAATNEVLLDDALLLIRALGQAGVPIEAEIVTGLWHMWPLWPGMLPEADSTLGQVAVFLQTASQAVRPT